jgi:hypothetical protein
MADRNENVLSWNVPNVITIWLMVALLWVVMGVGSHFVRKKTARAGVASGVTTDNSGNVVRFGAMG